MAQNLSVQLNFAGLPGGEEYCFTNPNRFALDIIGNILAYIPGNYNLFNYGNNEPAVNDRNKPWIRTDEFGVFDKLYTFSGGKWISPNPEQAGSVVRRWVECAESAVWSYDGGDGSDPVAVPPTDATGAMWKVDHNYDARFPLAAGVFPSTTIVNPSDAGGEEKHTLISAEVPLHKHLSPWMASLAGSDATTFPYGQGPPIAGSGKVVDDSGGSHGDRVLPYGQPGPDDTSLTSHDQPHNNIPPYRAGYMIMRTSRRHYTPV